MRLFFWSLGIWQAFRKYDSRYDRGYVEEKGTNLCFFFRVILVYMPLVLLVHGALVVAAIASLTAVPIYLFGARGYGWTVGVTIAVIGTVWGLALCARCIYHPKVGFTESRKALIQPEKTPLPPNFFDVLWAYIVSTKQRICPLIMFNVPKESGGNISSNPDWAN